MPTATLTEGSGRADRLLKQAVPDIPRTLIKSLFLAGSVQANGRRVRAGDHLEGPVTFEWTVPDSPAPTVPSDLWEQVTVLHDAGTWIALNKPTGLHAVRLKGRGGESLEDWLDANEPGTGKLLEHGLANRLDQDTSGIIIAARDSGTRDRLRADIAGAEKVYWTAVCGSPPDEGTVNFELRTASRGSGTVTRYGRRAQRTGETRFRILGRRRGFSLLEVQLVGPGARHQIRAHLAGEGYPVAGDPLYSGKIPGAPPRLALHAWRLRIPDGKDTITAPVPDVLRDWWESLPRGGDF